MNTAELKEYLGIVVDMEKNIYLQAKTAGEITKEISLLGHRNSFVKPVEPTIPMRPATKNIFSAFITPYIVIFLIACFMMMDTGGSGAPFFIAVNTIFWGTIISLPICISRKRFNTTASKNYGNAMYEYKNSLSKYQKALQKYQDDLTEENKRLDRENNQKIALQNSLEKLQSQNKASAEVLQKIYSKNIIYPKYRNLVMVCALQEYICAGRCTTLEGHEGAYNILEMEIRMDRIITRLDKVIATLNEIKASQYMVYTAIQDANHKSAQILDSTSRMAESIRDFRGDTAQLNVRITELQQTSAITAYHTERVQKELAYMNRMNYLSGRNDHVFWNVPPT